MLDLFWGSIWHYKNKKIDGGNNYMTSKRTKNAKIHTKATGGT